MNVSKLAIMSVSKVSIMQQVRSTIVQLMTQVAREHEKVLAPLNDELVLVDCGLDSLGFAVLVARLEDKLGVDPFTTAEDVFFPITFGDFVKVYENGAR
jgi:acyl carrier protein